jgi:hypothetical protein
MSQDVNWMTDGTRDFGMHHPDTGGPSISLQRRAFVALAEHPLFIAAKSHEYFNPAVMLDPKASIDRVKWSKEVKTEILRRLADSDTVLLMCCMTSNAIPEPLSGGGTSYDFVLHPKTLEILHASTSSWRS